MELEQSVIGTLSGINQEDNLTLAAAGKNKTPMEALRQEALDMLVSDNYSTLAKRNKLAMIDNQKRVSAQLKAFARE